jgi:hypothetical protein
MVSKPIANVLRRKAELAFYAKLPVLRVFLRATLVSFVVRLCLNHEGDKGTPKIIELRAASFE